MSILQWGRRFAGRSGVPVVGKGSVGRTRRLAIAAMAALAAMPVHAYDIENSYPIAFLPEFPVTSGSGFDTFLTADIIITDLGSGTFQETFTIRQILSGTLKGGVSTSLTSSKLKFTATDLDFTGVTVNGLPGTVSSPDGGVTEYADFDDIPVTGGALNTIVFTGLSRGNGSFSGGISFTASAVPEPATWAMMLCGLGACGAMARRRRMHGGCATPTFA